MTTYICPICQREFKSASGLSSHKRGKKCINPLSIIESFFERHMDKVNWASLSQNPAVSEAFFERHIDRVDWIWLSENSILSESFFEKHIDKVNWVCLSRNPT